MNGAKPPDGELLQSWRDAIDGWERRASGATSSITGGGAIAVLEAGMSDLLDGRPCVSVGSGTAALAACLMGVGVRPGDEVITSALDWPAAADAIAWVGARAVFADVDADNLTVAPASVAEVCTPRTRCVVATHLFGVPADVPAIRWATSRSLAIVEDCAQAFGARLDGRPVGTLGDAAAFSFGPGKTVDAGEGGVAVFADEAAWEAAVVATQHRVRALATSQPDVPRTISSRMHPFAAILALAALPAASDRVDQRRRTVAALVRERPRLRVAGLDGRRAPSWWRIAVDRAGMPDMSSGLGLCLPDGISPTAVPRASDSLQSFGLVDERGIGSVHETPIPGSHDPALEPR